MSKKIIFFFIVISIVILVALIYLYNGNNDGKKESGQIDLEKYQSLDEEDNIMNLKEQYGITGKNEMYTIKEEYDGRKVLTIKPSIQYKVIMAGILNQKKPDLEHIDELLQNEPKQNGIWVSKDARGRIEEIIESVTKNDYTIDQNGYLKPENEYIKNNYDEKLKKLIASSKLFSIDIKNYYYVVDDVTGEIVQYLFEEMDPYTPFEYFEDNDKTIFIISSNSKGKNNYNKILEEIIECME